MPSKLNHLASATLAASLILLPIDAHADQGGIQTDGTVGGVGFINQPQNLTPPDSSAKLNITENMGSRSGTNLLHSFTRFNINDGQTVTFTENTPNSLDNVIARVTGGEQSTLHGLLESTPGGHANFYLINPAGVLFGKNARINVAGDLHVSTANQLRFANGGVFDANPAYRNVLSADAPTAFGFTQSTVANNSLLKDAKLTIDGAQLGIKAGKTLDLVGNNIIINNARLSEISQLSKSNPSSTVTEKLPTADAIEIRLVAKKNNTDVSLIRDANGYLPLPKQRPNTFAVGDISIENSRLDVSGNGGGRIGMWGNDIKIIGIGKATSILQSENQGDISATAASGVEIWGDSVSLANSEVSISTLGKGGTGNLKVIAVQDLTVNDKASLELSGNEAVPAIEQGVGITLMAGYDLTLDGGTSVKLTSNSSLDGDLTVKAGWNIKLDGSTDITITSNKGSVGKLLITAGKNLDITDNSHIDSIGSETGDLAIVTMRVKGDINLKAGGSISAATSGSGKAGPLTIKAGGDIVIDGQLGGNNNRHAYISTGTSSSGPAGTINVQASGDFILRNGGSIASNSLGQGKGGNIDIKAQNIILEGNISSSSTEVGDGGSIHLKSGDLVVLRHAKISTRATGSRGSGGDINITGNTLLLQSSSITADTSAKAHGGNIDLRLTNIIADYLVEGGNTLADQNTDTQGFSRISAAAPNGVSGLISFTSPQLNLSGVLAGLGSSQFLATGLDNNACVRNGTSSLSRGGLDVTWKGLLFGQ